MKRVREALAKVPGVQNVEVDFSKKVATLTGKPGTDVASDSIKKALPKPYGVTKITKKVETPKKGISAFVVSVSGMT